MRVAYLLLAVTFHVVEYLAAMGRAWAEHKAREEDGDDGDDDE